MASSSTSPGSLLSMVVSLLWMVSLLPVCTSVLIGDEHFGRVEGGVFWTFHSRGVSIVNPHTCQVEHSFETDGAGGKLPAVWSRGVYMERQIPGGFSPNDAKDAFVFINSGENRGQGRSEVLVMTTTEARPSPVLQRIQVGGNLGNAYAVHNRNQFWTHSSEEGYFYVVDLMEELNDPTREPIKAIITTAQDEGHLLWEIGMDDTTLILDAVNIGYATSKSEPSLFIIDMLQHKQVDVYNFTLDVAAGTCAGAKSMAYSDLNQHLYVECDGKGGILEYDVSFQRTPVFVAQHPHTAGVLYETPDKAYVCATDKATNAMYFFKPQRRGEISSDPLLIIVDGHPEPPTFYEHPETKDYVACMPLTQNTNGAHIHSLLPTDRRSADRVVCDYWNQCSPAETIVDVDSGMCLYDGNGTQLLTAKLSQLEDVQNRLPPFGEACQRCASASQKDYNSASGDCICTPHCGSCAPEEYPVRADDPLLLRTGYQCIDVKDALLGMIHASDLIPGAGAVKRAPAEDGWQCAMEEPTRPHRHGGNYYDASISTVPTNELIVVDMRVQALQCRVELPGEPQQVIYVPTTYHYKNDNSNQWSAGAKAFLAIGVLLVVVATCGMLALRGRICQRNQIEFVGTVQPKDLELEPNGELSDGSDGRQGDANPFRYDDHDDDPGPVVTVDLADSNPPVTSGTMT